MSRPRRIRVAAFVALLVAWPIGVEWVRRQFPNAAGVYGVCGVASLFLYLAIAAALRSRVIAGLLGGGLVWAMTYDSPRSPDTERWHEWWGQLFLWSVIGLFAGFLWEGLRSIEPPEPDGQGQ
jgi:hypothetical protein